MLDKLENQSEMDESNDGATLVSIIMPVYNRMAFLSDAISSILAQTHKNWELIVVDDGSTDDSVSLIKNLSAPISHRVVIIEQENAGPAGARNRGFSEAKGEFIAFYDSDDLWKPKHLSLCMQALASHQEISWVYTACERVDHFSQTLLQGSTFYKDGSPNPLFSIAHSHADGTYILERDKAILLQLTDGLNSGFQNSLLKRSILEKHLIPRFRVGEDRLFVVMALKSGFNMGFIDDVTVTYRVHDQNISDTNANETNYEKRIASMKMLLQTKEELEKFVSLNATEKKVHRKKLANEIFWELGYSLYRASGNINMAITCYKRGLKLNPYKLSFYKTFIKTIITQYFNR